MRLRSKVVAMAIAAAVAVGAGGCGAVVDKIVDEALSQGGVEIDRSGGEVKIETQDGAITVNTEGEVPADFPAGVPLPNAKPNASSVQPGLWSLHFEGVDRAAVDKLIEDLEAAGFEQSTLMDLDEMIQTSFTSGDMIVSVLWSGDSDEEILIYGVMVEQE